MADEPGTPDADEDELLLDEPLDDDARTEGDSEDDPSLNDEAEEVPTFGDEAEPQEGDSGLVKHLRQQIRDRDKRLAEAERSAPRQEPVAVGEKPTLAGCEYDEDRYEAELDAWKERKAAAERQRATTVEAGEEQQRVWSEKLALVAREKAELRKADADDAFENVRAALGEERANAILYMAEDGNAAKLMYALGTHPTKLAEIAAQTDPIRFVKDVAKLEGQLKMVKRRAAPEPDTPERGSARISRQGADKKLEKLEKEADRTGDRTALISYRKELAKAGK